VTAPPAPPDAAPGPRDGSWPVAPPGAMPPRRPVGPPPGFTPPGATLGSLASARWAPRLVPWAAGLALALSCSALSGVLQGHRWLWYVLASVGLVVLLGVLARLVRLPLVAVLAVQLVGELLLLTGLFSTDAVLWVLPGPEALAELWHGLGAAMHQIEGGVPPVQTSTAMALLVSVGFGLVAIGVDALAVAGHGPAVCGLVVLGAYTVPTALAPRALPDWSLAAGALGYSLLLVTEHRRRQARRGIPTGRPARAGGPPPSGFGRLLHRLGRAVPTGSGAPLAILLTAIALAAALGVGVLATPIGTHGRFTGNGEGEPGSAKGQFGLNPFTSLRGQLDNEDPNELLRVRGLPDAQYLRSLTLNRYVPQVGWQLPDRLNGVSLDQSLPSGLAIPVNNPTATVRIQNVGLLDQWLPLYGQPMGVTGVVSGRWHYDVLSGTAYTELPVHEPAWTERAAMPSPSVPNLENIPDATDVNPTYLDTGGVDPRISQIARTVTKQAHTPFDRTVALNRYFLDPAFGFKYSVETRPGNSGDALVDFLTRGKTGYCEQFASAMAVMLRTVGVPARVAVGFSSGKAVGDYRSITTADAHAWVEAYFAGVGWLPFDPTPLDDGRSVLPTYVANAPQVPINVPSTGEVVKPKPGGDESSPQASPEPGGQGSQVPKAEQPGEGTGAAPNEPKPDPSGSDSANPSGGSDPSDSGSAGSSGNSDSSSGSQPGGSSGSAGGGGGESGDSGAGAGDGPGDGTGGSGAEGLGAGLGKELSIAGLLVAVWAILLVMVLLLGAVGLLFLPLAARGAARRRRLALARGGGPNGAEAAWREVLAEFQDRGSEPGENDTLRATARHLVRSYRLDGAAVDGMKTVIGAVERGWYAEYPDPGPGDALVTAVHTVRMSLRQSAPMPLAARLWPRSVLPGRRWWRRVTGRINHRARILLGG